MDPSIRSSLYFLFFSDLSLSFIRTLQEIFGKNASIWICLCPLERANTVFFPSSKIYPKTKNKQNQPTTPTKIWHLRICLLVKITASLKELLMLLNIHILFFLLFLLSKWLKTITSVASIKKKKNQNQTTFNSHYMGLSLFAACKNMLITAATYIKFAYKIPIN